MFVRSLGPLICGAFYFLAILNWRAPFALGCLHKMDPPLLYTDLGCSLDMLLHTILHSLEKAEISHCALRCQPSLEMQSRDARASMHVVYMGLPWEIQLESL